MTLNAIGFNKIGPDPFPYGTDESLVFFIKSNSTVQIYINYEAGGEHGKIPLEGGIVSGKPTNFTEVNSSLLGVNVIPDSLPLENANITAIYTITSQNVKGLYWIGFAGMCGSFPLAVGLDSSQINPSDIPLYVHTCPAAGIVNTTILGISGGTTEYKLSQRL